MTNEEKFKKREVQLLEFIRFCLEKSDDCSDCPVNHSHTSSCYGAWRKLDAEEKEKEWQS